MPGRADQASSLERRPLLLKACAPYPASRCAGKRTSRFAVACRVYVHEMFPAPSAAVQPKQASAEALCHALNVRPSSHRNIGVTHAEQRHAVCSLIISCANDQSGDNMRQLLGVADCARTHLPSNATLAALRGSPHAVRKDLSVVTTDTTCCLHHALKHHDTPMVTLICHRRLRGAHPRMMSECGHY